VDFDGGFYRADGGEILPRGPRAKGPPLLIAGKGPRMLRLTAQHADAWNAAWFGEVSQTESRVADLRQAVDAEGRDPATMDAPRERASGPPSVGRRWRTCTSCPSAPARRHARGRARATAQATQPAGAAPAPPRRPSQFPGRQQFAGCWDTGAPRAAGSPRVA